MVEDDEDVAAELESLFTRAGHEVIQATDGRSALRRAYERRPDLVVLDVTLPELDGWGVLERLRDLTDIPVIMLTGQDQPTDQAAAAQASADEYLPKPFLTSDLVARVEGLLRRHPPSPLDEDTPYDDGVLRLDPAAHRVTVHGRQVHSDSIEFRLLHALVRRAGTVLRRSELLAQAWNDPTGIAPGRVKFAVLRLRRKLGWSDPKTSPLESIRSVGYRYQPPE